MINVRITENTHPSKLNTFVMLYTYTPSNPITMKNTTLTVRRCQTVGTLGGSVMSESTVLIIGKPYSRILAIKEKLKRHAITVLNELLLVKFLKTTEFTESSKARYPRRPRMLPRMKEKAMYLTNIPANKHLIKK